jgi:predicted DNA-binding protein with PD1-like motif
MQTSRIDGDGGATYVVVLADGDEAVAALTEFAHDHRLSAAQITAVGAFSEATVGWFDRAAKEYKHIPVARQCEVLSLVGDVALGPDDRPALHVHAVLGLEDGTTRGGHLLEGRVSPTLEVIVREAPARLHKRQHPDIGLALIDLDRTASPED